MLHQTDTSDYRAVSWETKLQLKHRVKLLFKSRNTCFICGLPPVVTATRDAFKLKV